MRNIFRNIAVCVTVLVTLCMVASAAIMPYASLIMTIKDAYIEWYSPSKASVSFAVETNMVTNTIGVSTVKVYDITDQKTTIYSGKTVSNARRYTNKIYISVVEGHTYYADVTLIAQNSDGSSATAVVTTNTITI